MVPNHVNNIQKFCVLILPCGHLAKFVVQKSTLGLPHTKRLTIATSCRPYGVRNLIITTDWPDYRHMRWAHPAVKNYQNRLLHVAILVSQSCVAYLWDTEAHFGGCYCCVCGGFGRRPSASYRTQETYAARIWIGRGQADASNQEINVRLLATTNVWPMQLLRCRLVTSVTFCRPVKVSLVHLP